MQSSALTSETILAIPEDRPDRLFSGDPAKLTAEYRALARAWHPDHNPGDPDADAVFARLVRLHLAAKEHLRSGTWPKPGAAGSMDIPLADGKILRRAYRRAHAIDGGAAGRMFVGDVALTLVFEPAMADLVKAAETAISQLRYSSDRMRELLAPRLPKIEATRDTADGGRIVVLSKTKDVLLLRDVLAHSGGKMDPRHVSWIISDLLDLCCYLQWAKLTHNAISADTLFISPPHHSTCLLGGWHYAAGIGLPLKALPSNALAHARPALLSAKRADATLDLDMVRALGRELLADPAGTSLRRNKDVPPAISAWLCSASSGDAVADARSWRAALESGFGKRTFVALNLSADDLYGSAAG